MAGTQFLNAQLTTLSISGDCLGDGCSHRLYSAELFSNTVIGNAKRNVPCVPRSTFGRNCRRFDRKLVSCDRRFIGMAVDGLGLLTHTPVLSVFTSISVLLARSSLPLYLDDLRLSGAALARTGRSLERKGLFWS